MDGIKPTLSDLNDDDQTPVYDPVKVDLLHPSESAQLDPSAAGPGARVAPITPPFHAAPESSVEFVKNTPPPPLPEPVAAPRPAPVPEEVPTPTIPDTSLTPPPASADLGVVASAAPAAPAPSPSPRGSKTGIIIVIIVLLLLAGGAAAYYFLIFQKKPVATAPAGIALTAATPTKLTQQGTSGSLALPAGATTDSAPVLGATLVTKATTGSAVLQVEVEPLGTAFTGSATASGQAVSANGSNLVLSVKLKSLTSGSYHWQARTKVGSVTSAWVAESAAGSTTADFIVATTAPSAPTVSSVGGGTISGTTITTTQNQPVLSGTAPQGSTLSIQVTPDNITLTPTVAVDGSWTVTPSQQLANGAHTLALTTTNTAGNHGQVSYTLNINPVAVVPNNSTSPTTTTPSSTPVASSGTTSTTTAPTTVAAPGKLAATGDPTEPISLTAFGVGLTAVLALVYLRRYDRA